MREIVPKKKFGQNFLTDKSIVERIISSAGQLENKTILEIGGGTGNLTKYLMKAKPKRLLVIEIDKDYIKILKGVLKSKSVETAIVSARYGIGTNPNLVEILPSWITPFFLRFFIKGLNHNFKSKVLEY